MKAMTKMCLVVVYRIIDFRRIQK
ncbi:hypothetical protein SFRURICE_018492 [Spodoptera frugiperda]|nr:hypothetical protein SFRURICE_018492 [Spodoptera frugiperda]